MSAKLAVLAALALGAAGQGAQAQPYEARETVTYEAAKQIVNTCEAMAKAKAWPIAIWVLDVGGEPVYFAATKGVSTIGVRTAKLKAETALLTGAPSEARAANLATPVGQRSTEALGLFPIAGGLPLMHDGKVIGAVGAGGGRPENGVSVDQLCAQAGIDAAFKK